ncbi:uncharacterized protein LOC132296437 [Cornus florida]|uniref:uncharacterized protein LOC132296437 n=1 Tax=Cornus florida TaxID=4283 RepID=UPI00289B663F|nr:uncharacterized protein LOC132296437 [Cornus florida]
MGKRPYYHRFKGYAEKRWANKVTVCYLKDSFFIVRFESEEEVMQTLSRIHTFEGQPIIIKQWDKNVNLLKEVLDSVPVWLRLHNLPVYCHDAETVSKVCSNFSKPIYMDDPELHRDKGDYVRVMVEVGVKEVLPESTIVDIHGSDCFVDLEYEWKPTLCDICKKVDHLEDRCPTKVLHTKSKKGVYKWVVKNKGKKIVEDKVFDTMPVQASALVIHEVVQVSNAFAVLEENEAPGTASEEIVVADVNDTVVVNLEGHTKHVNIEVQESDTVIIDESVTDTENMTQLGLNSDSRTKLIFTHVSLSSVGGEDPSNETTPSLGQKEGLKSERRPNKLGIATSARMTRSQVGLMPQRSPSTQ